MSEVIDQKPEVPSTDTALAVAKAPPTRIEDGVVRFENVSQAYAFAQGLADSGLVPRGYEGKPKAILAAIQHGGELGFSPMQALKSISVINGTPAVWGDAVIALAHKSGKWEDFKVTWSGSGDTLSCKYSVTKKGIPTPFEWEFSMQDAKTADLLGKGVWKNYPKRMLFNRARAFALRDAFAEDLRGLGIVEEVEDYNAMPAREERRSSVSLEVQS